MCVCVCVCMCVCERERERERESERQRQTDRQTDRDRETKTETDRQTDRQTDRKKEGKTCRMKKTKTGEGGKRRIFSTNVLHTKNPFIGDFKPSIFMDTAFDVQNTQSNSSWTTPLDVHDLKTD